MFSGLFFGNFVIDIIWGWILSGCSARCSVQADMGHKTVWIRSLNFSLFLKNLFTGFWLTRVHVFIVWTSDWSQVTRRRPPSTSRLSWTVVPQRCPRNPSPKPETSWVPLRRPAWRLDPWAPWEDCQVKTSFCRSSTSWTKTRRRRNTLHPLVRSLDFRQKTCLLPSEMSKTTMF